MRIECQYGKEQAVRRCDTCHDISPLCQVCGYKVEGYDLCNLCYGNYEDAQSKDLEVSQIGKEFFTSKGLKLKFNGNV